MDSVTLLVFFICGMIAAAIAASKGRNVIGWFFGGFFLQLIGIIIVAVLSNLKEEREKHEAHRRERRRLREQLKQERVKNEAFRRHAARRLDTHDDVLQIDTKSAPAVGAGDEPGHIVQSSAAPPPMPKRPERQWFYEKGGDPQGPVDESVLAELLRAGEVSSDALVWTEGMEEWKPAREAGMSP